MQESGKTSWLLKKSYEIAYAVFRVSAKMDEHEFAGYFKSAAAMLLGAIAQEDYGQALKATATLEYLTRFAVDLSIMGIANGDVMVSEINSLATALEEVPAKGDLTDKDDKDIDLSAFFSKKSGKEPRSGKSFDSGKKVESGKEFESGKKFESESGNLESGNSDSGNDFESGNPESGKNESGNDGGINGILKSAIRQSAILERIRQIGNCRMKDIQEILPNASERTLRYDLQTLVEQNLVDRIGSGGPSVFYRVKEGAGIEFGSQETVDNEG
jgi:hypothetical protein